MASPQAAVLSLRWTMVICSRLFRARKETPPPVCQRGSLGDDTQQSQKEEEIDFSSRSGPYQIHALDSPLQGRSLSSKLNVTGHSAQIESLASFQKEPGRCCSAMNARQEKPSLGYIG